MKKIVYKKLAQDTIKFFLLTIFTISIIIWVLQAVNYLDFVIEDGHGFLVYFNYTLLSFPKIFSRIYPFAIFISFSYILLRYEEKNELIIYWNFGVKKIEFINFFIKFSLLFTFLSLLLNALIVPLTQDKARSFIRSSNLDLFESMLKPRKFVDIIKNLTIYYDRKNINGELKNIFLNDKISLTDSQTTFAKTGVFEIRGNKKILILYDGKTINNVDGKIYEFKFNKTDFNISRFSSTAIIYQKTQETNTIELVQCLLIMNNFKKNIINKTISEINNCTAQNLKNIYETLYSRLIKPLYTTFIIAISLLFILKSKSNPTFRSYKFKIYLLGFIFIIFLESSSKFISIVLLQNLFLLVLPFFLLLVIYLFFLRILMVKNK
jgi:lipopolysaccharide export system permease protein